MENLILNSAASGVFISLAAYGIGTLVKRKWNSPLANPLLIAIILVILFLKLSGVEYETYNASAKYLTYLLAPATVSLAIPMYERMQLLKENYAAILTGILSGVLASLVCVLAMALVFHLSQAEYVTLLPKSVTTVIGMDIAKELGGHSEIAAAVIIITGVLGNMAAEPICRIFAIRHPVAKGIALGTSAHAIGTAKAMEMGETEGAMSSLAIVVAGVCTVVGATVFAGLL
ncbi:LrgB family protein [Merdimonas faecis]|uniref:LrgB family protein n=1 Tax=Merdimonas faecis TaxID=1653435 RepID=UPI0023FA0349|nr:LrgB family protein [Merdimonas faecis]